MIYVLTTLTWRLRVLDQFLEDGIRLLKPPRLAQSLRLAEQGFAVLRLYVRACSAKRSECQITRDPFYPAYLISGLESTLPVAVLYVTLGHVRVNLLLKLVDLSRHI